ncbi:MAG: type II methionyl aminopeptidase [Candidatus Pacearchaeota archaeon]
MKDLIKSGKILEKTLSYAKNIVKNGIPLIDVTEKIEEFVRKQNAKLAFPVNLSINEIAAHYSAFENDKNICHGLIKIDIGINYNGNITDAAISIDLAKNEENKKIIQACKNALKSAIKIIKPNIQVYEIGKIIEEKIKEYELKPIYNLMGHCIEKNKLHTGKSIPNYNNYETTKIYENEVIAIEPFATLKNASGYVIDGERSSIWILKKEKKVRLYREVYEFIKNNFNGLPFSERWVKFQNYLLALNYFKSQEILYNYPQLIEKTKAKVGQFETTILVKDKPKILVDVFNL